MTSEPYGGGKKLNNITFKIIIPSILFSLIEVYPKKLVRGEDLDIFDFVYETLGGGTYWFTSALAVAEIIIVVIMMASKSRNVWFYVLICAILSFLGSFDQLTSQFLLCGYYLWAWGSGLTALIFIVMGGVYYKYERRLIISWPVMVGLLLIWVASIHILCDDLKFTPFNRWLNIQGVVVGTLASFLLVCICKKILYLRILEYIGKNSIGFYFLSGGVPTILSLLTNRMIGEPIMMGLVIVFIGSVIVSFAVVYILNRYLPFVFDLRKFSVKR